MSSWHCSAIGMHAVIIHRCAVPNASSYCSNQACLRYSMYDVPHKAVATPKLILWCFAVCVVV